MPTFTAMALDRLLEPGASKSVDKSRPNAKPPIPNSKPIPDSKLDKRNSTSSTERKVNRPQISPALYATPEPTPLPDSPSSFPPSPYIVNHKRRGPRLLKSFSEQDVSFRKKTLVEGKADGNARPTETKDDSVILSIQNPIEGEHDNGDCDDAISNKQTNSVHLGSVPEQLVNAVISGGSDSNCGMGSSCRINGLVRDNDVLKLGPLNLDRSGDVEDFFDPTESMSCTSNTEGEDNTGAESATNPATSVEFYDAWEELSSESGPPALLRDIEAELREIRLSLLMEIERRKQADETLVTMQINWEKIRQQLAVVGVALPADLTSMAENELLDTVEELTQQVDIARFVSDSVGRGMARAEIEMEMEAQIKSKNFEIARLCDRLHYYEAVNREMSQRNQEAVEMARRDRQKRERRQRWIWGSIATAITLGTAALAWSYIPAGKGLSSSSSSQVPQHDDAAK